MYVARHQTTAIDGDFELAREYLERVAASNSEEVGQATELLKKVKGILVAKTHTGGAEAQTKAPVQDSAGPSQPIMTATAGPESGDGPTMTTE
jgi:anaphase-promoting complex subunit 8